MNIAIFGKSCTGKSTLARLMAQHEQFDIRACGDTVRTVAGQLGVLPEHLPLNEHASIDAETATFAMSSDGRPRIVEGRFLHYVLARCGAPIFLVELTASVGTRVVRWRERIGTPINEEWLTANDLLDMAFQAAAYSGVQPLTPALTINASARGPEECMTILLQSYGCVRKETSQPGGSERI